MSDSVPAPAPRAEPVVRHYGRRRLRVVRARTESATRLTKRELEFGKALYPEPVEGRPGTRGDCVDGVRPCPYVGCRYHLFLDVSSTDGIKRNFPDLEPDELPETCALDVADRGGTTLEGCAELLNVTRERIRQIESRALAKLGRRFPALRQGVAAFTYPGGEEP